MVLTTVKRACRHAKTIPALMRVKFSRDEAVRANARKHIADTFGKMHGLPQKLGQMLSFRCSNQEGEDDFRVLQNQATAWPLEQLIPVAEKAWGKRFFDVVAKVETAGFAASLGQVHQATLRDGRVVAIKFQYPGIREAVQTDLHLLGWLGTPANFGRFDLQAYRAVLEANLNRELDYRSEANEQRTFRSFSNECAGIQIPKIVDELSSEQLLVSEWLVGKPWEVIRQEWTEEERRQLANSLIRFFLNGLFHHGKMQADWHPGNLQFDRSNLGPRWICYDFGSVCQFTAEQRATLLRLILATRERNESPWPLFLKLGFNDTLLAPLRKRLPALCRILFEPFLDDRPFDVRRWRLGDRVAEILGDDRWNFRMAGPANLILFLRAMHGLIFYLGGLQTPVCWWRPLQRSIEILHNEMESLEIADCEPFASDSVGEESLGLAKWLKVRVVREGTVVAQITQPVEALERLHEILDDTLRARIAQDGTNLDVVVRNIRLNGFRTGPVFSVNEQSRRVDIWLE